MLRFLSAFGTRLRPGGLCDLRRTRPRALELRARSSELRRHPARTARGARTLQLLVGLLAVGVGIGLLIRADLGVASWDVLHVGLAGHVGLSVGQTAMLVGVLAAGVAWLLGERPRLGSLVPLAVIGPTIDATMLAVSTAGEPATQVAMLTGGVLTLALGVGAYVASDHGAGPSDLVFLGVAKRGLPVWASRLLVDGTVVATGWAIGGPVGVGTVVVTTTLGPLVALALRGFDLAPAREVVADHDASFLRGVADELEWELA